FSCITRPPPSPPLFPYTTLFRSLEDRISSLRKVNIYEGQRYRHIVGLPMVLSQANGAAKVETPFLIVRIMRDGAMDVFATGCYRDRKSTRLNSSHLVISYAVFCL